MTQGLTRAQLGVTDAMIAAYGATVFQLSNNHQIRRGDPIRALDFDAIEAHRAELGMSDAQIAARIGLTPAQVTLIRNLEERRRFRTGEYHVLNQLGGGKRYRADRMTPLAERFSYSEAALELRAALHFAPERVQHYVQNGDWTADTLPGWLARNAADRPDAPALQDADGTLSWSELHARVMALRAGLYAAGLRPGDVAAVMLPNTRAYIESFLAIAALGAVMSTLYMTFRVSDLRHQLTHARARMLIAVPQAGEFAPVAWALQAREMVPDLATVVSVGEAVSGALRYDDLFDAPEPPADLPAPTAADPFLLLYTSGTTSSPKAVPLNSHQMLGNARAGCAEHRISSGDKVLSAAPFGHLYGLYSVQMAVCASATTVLLPQFAPPALVQTLQGMRPTHLFAGPAHIAACDGAGLLEAAHFDPLKLVVLSGAAVPPQIVTRLAAVLPGGKVTQLWGMTELQAGLYTRPDDPVDRVAHSAGRPSPGAEARLVGPDGAPVPVGTDGELQIRGPSVFTGYFRNPEATAASFSEDGWFKSGDIARLEPDGNLTLAGRVKDVINRGGVKYNPQEIELLIEARDDVAQCAIAPVADPALGERACAYVVASPGGTPTLEAIIADLLAQGVSKHKLPEHLELRDALPLTATRKVIKGKLTSEA